MLVYARTTFGPFTKGQEYDLPQHEAEHWIQCSMMASVETVFPNAGKDKQPSSSPAAQVSQASMSQPSKRGRPRKAGGESSR